MYTLADQLNLNLPRPWCDRHTSFIALCSECLSARQAHWEEWIARGERKSPQRAMERHVVEFSSGIPVAGARTSDPKTSHLAAAKTPSQKLWERMIIIRNLVMDNPGQCIRWYVNALAERMPAPALDVPGCRDSVGAPKHDAGFYGVWATLFAQAEKQGLIVKVTDPLIPTEKLMKRSPYPGESMVHVYEACTAANLQRMEAERNAYFERLMAHKTADREHKEVAVIEQHRAKKPAKSEWA